MPFTDQDKGLVREAEEGHEKGAHQGAIDKIKGIDILKGTPLEQADVHCLYGYCLENLEKYLQAKVKYITALLSIRKKVENIKRIEEIKTSVELENLPQEVKFPNSLKYKIRYDDEKKVLILEEVISEEEKDKLLGLSSNNQYKEAVKALFHGSQDVEKEEKNANEFFKESEKELEAKKDLKGLVMAAKVFSALGDLSKKEKRFEEVEGQYNRAKELCTCVVNGGGPDGIKAEAHYRMAYALIRLKDYKGSKDNYEKAINLYENKKLQVKDRPKRLAKAYNSLGNLYRCEGYLEDAKLAYEKAVEVDTSFTPAMNNLAYTLYELGEYKKAKEWCGKAQNLEHKTAEFYDTLGCVHARLRMFEESKKFFEEALARKKSDPSIYNNYGEILRIAGAHEEAKKKFEDAIKLDKSFALPHSNLGDLYREQGDLLYGKEEKQKKYKEAEERYTIAKDLPDARFGLANLYVSQIEAEEEKDKKSKLSYKKALGEMKIICRSSGNWVKRRPSFYLLRGYIYGKLDEPYKAKMNFKKCRKLAKDDEEIASKAEDNLDALRAIELDKRMMWGGIALSILACIVLIVLTLFYLYPYPFSKGGSKGGTSSGSTKKVIVTKVEPGETTETTETKAGDTTTTVTKETKKGKEITETTETKEPGKTGKTDDEESLVGDTTYQIVAPFCLAFIALGVSLPFVTRVKFKDLEFDKTSIAGMSSELNLVR